ncbi:hypothetical protein K503DRAFT_336251 [Rhizopogon vinicolor AM-OR11-026]|uniref:Uncharacterized protein n=1 Tax=Rhizopogon vinicolor AM-OR11-026 TaxID=1314800 RepID=A0A1B7MTQ0_9AGAM|nr:hypothetical protein K503DRAFT_336251 [Rhizopogon vinicolor AM-OR11-026]
MRSINGYHLQERYSQIFSANLLLFYVTLRWLCNMAPRLRTFKGTEFEGKPV